jgi:hypothetical protein
MDREISGLEGASRELPQVAVYGRHRCDCTSGGRRFRKGWGSLGGRFWRMIREQRSRSTRQEDICFEWRSLPLIYSA